MRIATSIFCLLLIIVSASHRPGIKNGTKYYDMTHDGLITIDSLLNFYVGKRGLISIAQSIVDKFDNYDEYMHELGGHMFYFMRDVEYEFWPSTKTIGMNNKPRSFE